MEVSLTLEELVLKLNKAVNNRDYDGIKRCARLLQKRFVGLGDLSYPAKRLFERMDDWSNIKEGSVDTVKLMQVLKEEGAL